MNIKAMDLPNAYLSLNHLARNGIVSWEYAFLRLGRKIMDDDRKGAVLTRQKVEDAVEGLMEAAKKPVVITGGDMDRHEYDVVTYWLTSQDPPDGPENPFPPREATSVTAPVELMEIMRPCEDCDPYIKMPGMGRWGS